MTEPAAAASPTSQALHAALLDYFAAPGSHQLGLRQPALLFGSIREILQLAAGRGVPGSRPRSGEPTLREAAAFFLRAGLLYPGADHYAVLGLPPKGEPVELKERYRLLMRLIHPDFAAADAPPWPADAAVRVNRAYEVLSSPVLRKDYDDQLAALSSQRPGLVAGADARKAAPASDHLAPDDGRRLNRKAAWTIAAGVAALVLLMLTPRDEPGGLVQKVEVAAMQVRQAAADDSEPAAPQPAPQLIRSESLPPSSLAAVQETARQTALPAPAPLPAAPVATARPVAAPVPAPARVPVPQASLQPPRLAPPAPPARVASPVAAPAPPMVVAPAPMIVQADPAPPSRPAPGADSAARPPPAVEQAPAPSTVAAAPAPAPAPPRPAPVAITPVAALPQVAGPTLADAQPLLTQLLQMLETGSGDQLLRLLEGEARHAPPARALSRHYEQLVQGVRPVRLSHVEFKGESREGALLVTGRIRLHAGEPTIGSPGERLLIKAEFVTRGGRVMLKGLSGAQD